MGDERERQIRATLGIALVLIVMYALLVAGCAPPSAPTEALIGKEEGPPVPYFVWFGRPTRSQQVYGDVAWEQAAACVGADRRLLRRMPAFVLDHPIHCNTVVASGCAFFDGRHVDQRSVAVWRRDFDTAFPHEMIHIALSFTGGAQDHGNPVFQRCEWW
jgi:hypothetical protein